MRQTLAAAVQRSSTAANVAACGSHPSVGKVYTNSPHAQNATLTASPSYAPAGYGGYTPNPGVPESSPSQAFPGNLPPIGQSPIPPGVPGCSSMMLQADKPDQDRELDRLRKELRKAEEKSNFFRNQVISLQQQVSSVSQPVMAAHEVNAMPEELAKLRHEVHDERSRRQLLESQLQEKSSSLDEAQTRIAGLERKLAEASGRIAVLEQQVSEARAEAARQSSASMSPMATAKAWPSAHAATGNLSSAVTLPAGSPMASFAPNSLGSMASMAPQVGGQLDPLDPTVNPGGHKRVLIVGCDYAGKVGTLRAGVADAMQWARFFVKRCGFTEQDVRVLTDDPAQYQQKPCPEAVIATRANILRGLHWLVSRSGPGDQLFFVFCGHGAQIVVEERTDRKLCECAIVPTDVGDGGDNPRLVTQTDVHKALLAVPQAVQVTLINDACHAGRPLDRSGIDYLTEYVARGRVDYDKLRGHPVLPRFLELPTWKVQPQYMVPERNTMLHCQVVQWNACANQQFCVELPIDERPRGVFTYILISSILKVGVQASSGVLWQEARDLTAQLKGKWRLQQDVQLSCSRSTSEQQLFLRP
eukprot:TRINITY_DN90297_c0_g1_i1.p1 TRINITY_DN90297_c0_g1~~TRINITY_DN90297_c0_g1_i1.p1  ORF type:complete len:587 (+),score=81.73 TRINITY_DN90297_c0_g1_i1:84-1844(+)